MTAVTRVLPRQWDGRRLLRFLTGLAMIALAFTTHLPPAPEPTPASPASATAAAAPVAPAATAGLTFTEPATVTEPVTVLAARTPARPAPVVLPAARPLPLGVAPRVHGERAPPLS